MRKVENVASRIRDGMESLFDPERPYFSAWVKLYDADTAQLGRRPSERRYDQKRHRYTMLHSVDSTR